MALRSSTGAADRTDGLTEAYDPCDIRMRTPSVHHATTGGILESELR